MNYSTYFFFSIAIAAIGIVLAFINLATAPGRSFKTGEVKSIIVLHMIAALLYLGGGCGAIGFGIAWIIQVVKA